MHRFFFGSLWRDVWTAHVPVPVIDLASEAGGLTPLRRGGGFQTMSLRLRGGDGIEYKFRSIEKDPTKILAPELRSTFVADVLQDLISTANPYGALVTAPILRAVGVLQAEPRLVVFPDSPLLGEFRSSFANRLGMIEIHPDESDDEDATFAGSDKIVGTFPLLEKLQKDTEDRVHAPSFLKARLMDIFMGDWDRHTDQWRWARFGDGHIDWWHPIPRDRDQAFCRYDGLVPWVATITVPQIESCDDSYPQLQYLTYSGRHLDRRILSGLDWPIYDSLLHVLMPILSDSLIDAAVSCMPDDDPFTGGDVLASEKFRLKTVLRSRRDKLADAARRYYTLLTEEVDIHCSDEDEYVEVLRLANGDVSVSARSLTPGKRSSAEAVFFQRTFHADETGEIRIYLEGGDDLCVLRGTSPEDIIVRVVGGDGKDRFIDSSLVEAPVLGIFPVSLPSKTNMIYDDGRKTMLIRSASTVLDRTAVDMPPTPEMRYEPALRDWGSEWLAGLMGAWDADLGILFGGGPVYTRYGFRSEPYAYRVRLNAGIALLQMLGKAIIDFDFRNALPGAELHADLGISGFEVIHYFGSGNETPGRVGSDYIYAVKQTQVFVAPSMRFHIAEALQAAVGASLRLVTNDLDHDRLYLNELKPLGYEQTALLTVETSMSWDTRDSRAWPSRGVYAQVSGRYFPGILDLQTGFSSVRAEASAYASGSLLLPWTIAVRAGGQQLSRGYPFFESAFLGGMSSARGYEVNRFAGDAVLYAGAEWRAPVAPFHLLFPSEFGVLLFGETGRVFVEGETSDRWHPSWGGGIWIAPVEREFTVSASVGLSHESTRFDVAAGFAF